MASNKRWKCYFGCDADDVLHRFPNPVQNEERFKLWTSVLDPEMQERDPLYIYNSLRLCNKHFERCYHTPSGKLTRNAFPTLITVAHQAFNQPLLVDDSLLTESSIIDTPRTSATQEITQPLLQSDLLINFIKETLPSLSQDMDVTSHVPDNLEIPSTSQHTMDAGKKNYKTISANNTKKLRRKVYKLERINEDIFKHLKKTVCRLPKEKRLCTLIFDEVAIEPGLYFNKGHIIGFEDFGYKNTSKIADHALVFMLKSIKAKFKQPICFTFCQSCTKKDDLKYLIKLIIREIHKTGLKIIATICDQSQTNVSVIKSLRDDTRGEYLRKGNDYISFAFEIDGKKIFPLFDTPHLLKGVRNNLLKKDAYYIKNGVEKVAKWAHIVMLYNVDVGKDEIRLVNKLTDYHVIEKKIPKMKVKYAAQVFSQRVSSAIGFLARHNILPSECEDTSFFLLTFDKLFDSFNGHSYSGTSKELAGCLKNNSPHKNFWLEVIPLLKSIQFKNVIKKRDGIESIKFEKVPSIINWISNIETFLEMWELLKKEHQICNLITRQFNQDPLENFFCGIRSNGVRNTNPTCAQFVNAYKTLLVNNLVSPHSVNANCEADDNKCLQSLCHLLNDPKDSAMQEKNSNFHIDSFIDNLSLLITVGDDEHNVLYNESKRWCKGVNQLIKGKIVTFDESDVVKAQARSYYLKKLKKIKQ
ncbi:uncharacterized protein LOC123659416 [Melitaea cinxia]|uniref:uncharacterized protein LOC123659416 n=1 Tax=Melitaea cinxia TaxID=113334 RepID=UPI001E273131|nr:uncharacterized protein LOC123659416 [Melitaea cinxia]